LGLVAAMGGSEVFMWLKLGMVGDAPLEGITIGAIPMALWTLAFVAAIASIPLSVNNSILSLLYLGGRKGNDELITRDTYLARKDPLSSVEG